MKPLSHHRAFVAAFRRQKSASHSNKTSPKGTDAAKAVERSSSVASGAEGEAKQTVIGRSVLAAYFLTLIKRNYLCDSC